MKVTNYQDKDEVLSKHGCRKGFRSGGAIAQSRGLEAAVHT